MKEQFVTYEIALKLKELGFGMDDYLQLPFYYDEEGDLHLMEVCVSKKYNPSPNHLGADTIDDFEATIDWVDNSLDEIYLAPLWQQVIDWFRETYKLLIDSPILDEWNYSKWAVKITSLDKSIILEKYVGQPYWRIYRGYNSYEEARKQAILEAIEIVKKKNNE